MNHERRRRVLGRRVSLCASLAVTLIGVAACDKPPSPPVGSPLFVVLPSDPAASARPSPDSGVSPDIVASEPAASPPMMIASGVTVGVPSVPPDASTPGPSASAPLTAGVPSPDPSPNLPAATSIGPTPPPADAQPPSVSPGTQP